MFLQFLSLSQDSSPVSFSLICFILSRFMLHLGLHCVQNFILATHLDSQFGLANSQFWFQIQFRLQHVNISVKFNWTFHTSPVSPYLPYHLFLFKNHLSKYNTQSVSLSCHLSSCSVWDYIGHTFINRMSPCEECLWYSADWLNINTSIGIMREAEFNRHLGGIVVKTLACCNRSPRFDPSKKSRAHGREPINF